MEDRSGAEGLVPDADANAEGEEGGKQHEGAVDVRPDAVLSEDDGGYGQDEG